MIATWRYCPTRFFVSTLMLCGPAAIGLRAQSVPDPAPASSSSAPTTEVTDNGKTLVTTLPPSRARAESTYRTSRLPGFGVGVGLNGIGLDLAEPVGEVFNLRIGGEFLRYTGHFTEEGAQIDGSLQVGGGHVALDYFPFHNGFRISPQMRFAIQTEINATVLVPSGQHISLNGGDYVSSNTDPLRGTGFVDTGKTAPGLTIGYGNLVPRHGAHFSVPIELGFYYSGQPNLKVTFTGSACDPTQPQTIGCQSVNNDASFQADLKRFIARNMNNLSYASFFPVASVGFGYHF